MLDQRSHRVDAVRLRNRIGGRKVPGCCADWCLAPLVGGSEHGGVPRCLAPSAVNGARHAQTRRAHVFHRASQAPASFPGTPLVSGGRSQRVVVRPRAERRRPVGGPRFWEDRLVDRAAQAVDGVEDRPIAVLSPPQIASGRSGRPDSRCHDRIGVTRMCHAVSRRDGDLAPVGHDGAP